MPPHRALNAPRKTHNSERLERMAENKICHESPRSVFPERRKPETLRRPYCRIPGCCWIYGYGEA